MDPYAIIAHLAEELAAVRAELVQLSERPGRPPRPDAVRRPSELRVDAPMAPDAERKNVQLALSDKFLAQSAQVREIIRILVAAYPNCVHTDDFAGKLHTMRASSDGVPTQNQISSQVWRIRKNFGESAVDIVRGVGWRAGAPLRMVFDKPTDLDGEADGEAVKSTTP